MAASESYVAAAQLHQPTNGTKCI